MEWKAQDLQEPRQRICYELYPKTEVAIKQDHYEDTVCKTVINELKVRCLQHNVGFTKFCEYETK
jgi:hypothetical protein